LLRCSASRALQGLGGAAPAGDVDKGDDGAAHARAVEMGWLEYSTGKGLPSRRQNTSVSDAAGQALAEGLEDRAVAVG
jgi:hypothetical protein